MRKMLVRLASCGLAVLIVSVNVGAVAAQAVPKNDKEEFLKRLSKELQKPLYPKATDKTDAYKAQQSSPRSNAQPQGQMQMLSGGSPAEVHLTLPDKSKLVERQADVTFSTDLAPQADELSVRVDPAKTFQTMEGVGASMTESSAYLFSAKLSAAQRGLVFPALFSKTNGAGIDVVRTPWGVTDFSLSEYTYNDRAPGQPSDLPQNDFSINHDLQYIIPRLQDAKSVNPNLKLYFSPWTPPAWMKVPVFPQYPLGAGALKNGVNDPVDHYDSYATYLAKAVNGYTANWLWPDAFSPQNESVSLRLDPSTYYSASDHARLIRDFLGAKIANQTMAHPKILAYDDNWDNPYHANQILNDAGAAAYTAGTAFHCYKSEPTKQLTTQKAHPTKGIYFTECTGSNDPNINWAPDFRWGMRNLMINSVRDYAKTVIYWNLALDENFGPTTTETTGCQTCRGVMTVTSTGGVAFNTEYYILAHYGKFVNPAAQRIDSTTYGEGAIETVAFKNTDGSKVLMALNSGSVPRTFTVREGNAAFRYTLPAGAAATFKWTMADNVERDIDTGRIEAEAYTSSNPSGAPIVTITDEGKNDRAVRLVKDQSLAFGSTSFGGTPTSYQARYKTLSSTSGTIEFRLDNPTTGQILATAPFQAGANWQTTVVSTNGVAPSAGSHTLYAIIRTSGSASSNLLDLNWVKFANNAHNGNEIAGRANWRGYGVYAPNSDVPANVFDANNNTRWTTGFPMTYGHFFTVDMGKQTALDAVGGYSANGDRPRRVKVEVSDNNLDYYTVQPDYTVPADLYQIPLTAPAMGRYFRITELSDTAQTAWWSINELNAYYH